MGVYNLEVFLSGEFTGIDVAIEGKQIMLREADEHSYYRSYAEFTINKPMNVHVRLDGYPTTKWKLEIKINGQKVLSKKDELNMDGYITFNDAINF